MRMYFFLAAMLLSYILYAQDIDYDHPIILKGDSRDVATGEFSNTSIANEITGLGAYGMSGLSNFGTGDIYYVLIGSTISLFNNTNRTFSNTQSLKLFLDPDLEPEIAQIYASNNVTPEARLAENLSPILGCYFQHPLRYGDLNNDGSNELIIFAQDEFGALNFNMFSTVSNQVIFSARLATYDAKVNDRLTLAEGEVASASDPLANAPTDGQYLSKIAEERTPMIRGVQSATINFSKLYFDDFDENGTEDIIVWRKLYRSRENQDSLRGFQLLRENFFHHSFIGGEYVKQKTSSGQVQAWLSRNNLTWPQGYPGQSECAGESGQLIPEMHAPLLNDTEVLPSSMP